MKRNKSVTFIGILALVSTMVVSPALGLTKSEKLALKNEIAGVPSIELAGKAATLVASARDADKEATALTLVRAAIMKNSAVAQSIVSAVVAVLPKSAAIIAATAAYLVPEHTLTIAKAAAKAAPKEAGRIAAVLTRLTPQKADKIALAILSVAPQSKSQVVAAVTSAPIRTERRSAAIGGGNVSTTINVDIKGNPKLVAELEQPPIDTVKEGYASLGGDTGR